MLTLRKCIDQRGDRCSGSRRRFNSKSGWRIANGAQGTGSGKHP